MNVLSGKISSVTPSGELSLVKIDCRGVMISAIVIDTPDAAPYLKADRTIKLLFKETEVIIGKGYEHQISLQNRLDGEITHIQQGELLSKVTIAARPGPVTSIITTNAVKQLGLATGTEASALIKTNEIMLAE